MASQQSLDGDGGGAPSSLAEVDITRTGDAHVDLEDPRGPGTVQPVSCLGSPWIIL